MSGDGAYEACARAVAELRASAGSVPVDALDRADAGIVGGMLRTASDILMLAERHIRYAAGADDTKEGEGR